MTTLIPKFKQTGTGASNRAINLKLAETVSVKDFGAIGDGVTDDTAAIQAAIDYATTTGQNVLLNAGDYKTTSTLTITNTNTGIIGEVNAIQYVNGGSRINYTGAGSAILCSTWWGQIKNLAIHVSNLAAHGIEIGTMSRYCSIENVYLDATLISNTTTGIGIFLNSKAGFSGLMEIRNCYILQFKIGILLDGDIPLGGSWTTVSCFNVHLSGNSASRVAGSVGFYQRTSCNGVGTTFYGGAIENYEVGLYVETDASGGIFETDFEGNTQHEFVIDSDRFVGRVLTGVSANNIHTRVPGPTSAPGVCWQEDGIRSGEGPIYQNYYNSTRVHQNSGGGITEVENLILNTKANLLKGETPGAKALKFQVGIGQGDTTSNRGHPSQHFIQLSEQKIHWDNVSPATHTTGTQLAAWIQGDVCYNYGATVGQPIGWMCTVSGTPGTWVSMGNL
jgi:hypothetical protein